MSDHLNLIKSIWSRVHPSSHLGLTEKHPKRFESKLTPHKQRSWEVNNYVIVSFLSLVNISIMILKDYDLSFVLRPKDDQCSLLGDREIRRRRSINISVLYVSRSWICNACVCTTRQPHAWSNYHAHFPEIKEWKKRIKILFAMDIIQYTGQPASIGRCSRC